VVGAASPPLVAYGVAMLFANFCYGLGPLAERLIAPRHVSAFRPWAFALGLGFSIALPFAVPVIFYLRCVRGPCG
jgi:hypothetical protein